MNNKTALRTNAKNLRKTLPMDKISGVLAENIRACSQYQSAQNVMIFYPMQYEVNLLELLKDDKNFYFPRVEDEALLVCPYNAGEKLKKSKFNILEPCSSPADSKILDLVIVPALMADRNGYRLGYGGGFYDRFLSANNSVISLCAIPYELYVDELPHEDFDIAVDIVITTK